jgi:hypothetical protein
MRRWILVILVFYLTTLLIINCLMSVVDGLMYGTLKEWYWKDKIEILWEKPVSVTPCPPQTPIKCPGIELVSPDFGVVWVSHRYFIFPYILPNTRCTCGTSCQVVFPYCYDTMRPSVLSGCEHLGKGAFCKKALSMKIFWECFLKTRVKSA